MRDADDFDAWTVYPVDEVRLAEVGLVNREDGSRGVGVVRSTISRSNLIQPNYFSQPDINKFICQNI